ncbi:NAD-dependent epimerase/dehydratase family protein [Streptomyces sp. AK02-04a]|uniref:NAD-dependent epimerase/dehydratase family protein n=1 Tax=Streptomyces sp. AK02-04a TaxID=3028649 RepID=UPI0029A84EA6|nr:NAD-dependent epimerase/dehydratase family protein [Streptomyces sp. AK02-04a]MDX3763438.1 GDP-mannose 4,6-dehydratase [Streptomyces sp. AK02-04a]
MDRSSKYLVTGGAGFIGSHLVDALLDGGHSVVVLDDLTTGRQENLAQAQANPYFRFLRGSVMDASLVDELLQECDTVIHLAAAVGVKLIVEQPLRSFVTNTKGTETVIEHAQRYDRRIVIASTSEIYGKNSSGPLSETSDRILGSPSVARWSYSTAKAVDEIMAGLYHQERGLRSTVVRFFNTVGPRQSPAYGMVIPRFARQAVRGEALTIHAEGCQRRCFLHVADAVSALLLLLEHPGAVGETFNIGADDEISIRELADRVITQAASASPMEYLSYADAYGPGFEDMERRVPDTTKLRALTGWQPRFNLADILTDAIADAHAEWRSDEPVRVSSALEQRPPSACGAAPAVEADLAGR